MKNSNLHIVVRSAATLASFALLGAVLAGCGEDPILIAELIGAGQQPSSDPPATPAQPESGPPSPEAAPEEPAEPEPGTPGPSTEEVVQRPVNALEAPAFDILIRYCGQCHDTAPEEGAADFNYLSDLDLMLDNGQIVAGNKEESRVYVRMLAGTMPPASIGEGPSPEEIELVGEFIDSLPGGGSASD
jgi:hypothetical protein